MMVKTSLTVLVLILLSAPLPAMANPPGAREPLTFRNSGLYSGWNDHLLKPDSAFDFVLAQATCYEGRDNAQWNDWLTKARHRGKRVVAVLNPQAKDAQGQWYGLAELTDASDAAALEKLARVADEFLTQVDVAELYAITLAEENIFWNGRQAHLNGLYDRIKAKHDVPVYQWYSPSHRGSVPGIGWPNLKADGWVADEYHLDPPYMERAMRGYRILQKPVIQVIWAGGEKVTTVPFIPKRFAEQHDICRKYNIPAAYFTWYGEGGAWGFEDDPPATLKKVFEFVLHGAASAKSSPEPDPSAWDSVPWEIPAIPLSFSALDDRTPSYREEYKAERNVRVANDTKIIGFENVRWDTSAVELRPVRVGPSEASVAYAFESAFPISRVNVATGAVVTAGKSAAVTLSIVDSNGRTVRNEKTTRSGMINLTAPGNNFSSRQFKVIYTMTGAAATTGEVLAGVDSIEVQAEVDLPRQKMISLAVAEGGGVSYEENLASMSLFHTAEFRNLDKLRHSPDGLHASSGPGVLEVVQKFRSPRKVTLSTLHVACQADEVTQNAKVGIGLSLNGVDVVAKAMSEGSFNGELNLKLDDASKSIEAEEFYVHLFLAGNYGLITSYGVDGQLAK